MCNKELHCLVPIWGLTARQGVSDGANPSPPASHEAERKEEREGAQLGDRVLTSSSGHTTKDLTVYFGTPPPEGHTTSQWHLRLAVEPLISSHLVWDFELISINRIFWKHSGGLWVKYFTWLPNAFPITQRWVSKWFMVNGIKERLSNCCKEKLTPSKYIFLSRRAEGNVLEPAFFPLSTWLTSDASHLPLTFNRFWKLSVAERFTRAKVLYSAIVFGFWKQGNSCSRLLLYPHPHSSWGSIALQG